MNGNKIISKLKWYSPDPIKRKFCRNLQPYLAAEVSSLKLLVGLHFFHYYLYSMMRNFVVKSQNVRRKETGVQID